MSTVNQEKSLNEDKQENPQYITNIFNCNKCNAIFQMNVLANITKEQFNYLTDNFMCMDCYHESAENHNLIHYVNKRLEDAKRMSSYCDKRITKMFENVNKIQSFIEKEIQSYHKEIHEIHSKQLIESTMITKKIKIQEQENMILINKLNEKNQKKLSEKFKNECEKIYSHLFHTIKFDNEKAHKEIVTDLLIDQKIFENNFNIPSNLFYLFLGLVSIFNVSVLAFILFSCVSVNQDKIMSFFTSFQIKKSN